MIALILLVLHPVSWVFLVGSHLFLNDCLLSLSCSWHLGLSSLTKVQFFFLLLTHYLSLLRVFLLKMLIYVRQVWNHHSVTELGLSSLVFNFGEDLRIVVVHYFYIQLIQLIHWRPFLNLVACIFVFIHPPGHSKWVINSVFLMLVSLILLPHVLIHVHLLVHQLSLLSILLVLYQLLKG